MDQDKQFTLNLDLGSCSCRLWDCLEISCSHCIAVLRMLNMDCYSFVSEYYLSKTLASTYNGSVHPVGVHSDWRAKSGNTIPLPPIVKRPAGRPKKQRILSIGEAKCFLRCSHCGRKGHNSRSCKSPAL